MRKLSSTEERLAELSKLREVPNSPALRTELQKHLSSRVNLVVAKAAQIAGRLEDRSLVPDLIQAFDRFMVNAAQTDKGCVAKTEIVKALCTLECEREELFLKGIRHVQLEPAYGGPVDTACELRSTSAAGLVQMGSAEALTELVTLMADREGNARIGAIRALAYSGRDEGLLLLRFKVLTGDTEPAVIAECFTTLMELWPRKSLAFVAGYVNPGYPSLCEAAALALGESRLPEAFEALKEKWEGTVHPQFRRLLLLPMALVRQEEALEFLLSVIGTKDMQTASAAIAALGVYRHDGRVRERVRAAIVGPDEAQLLKVFETEFGSGTATVR
jgi:HEAT repeat protein